jgi:serine/threonine protein kinase
MEHRNSLQPGYMLHWYLIEKILGQGGFGITYLASDTNLNRKVAIKEYLPIEMAVRQDNTSVYPVSGEHGEQFKWGLERFISEAQTLARFKHPNIVRVHAVFRENNTAYMVMEYEHGRGLDSILKEKKTLTEDELNQIISPILSGLEAVHATSFIHRDIKPPNIYIREDNTPVLLDFGSARQSLGARTQTLTTMVSPGYAPFEQYAGKSMKQGPWTDIYGLGATMYRAVTGVSPPDSMDRSEAILHTGKDIYVTATEIAAGNYTPGFLTAIDHALTFKPEDRPQSISAWQAEMNGNAGFPDKKITETNSVSEATTIAMTPQVAQELQDGWIDKALKVIKRFLKWSSILLVILILLSVISQHKKRNNEIVEDTGSAHELAGPPVEETQTVEEVLQQVPVSENTQPEDIQLKDKVTIIQDLLAAAKVNINDLRLTSPAGDNAQEKYKRILEMEPGNVNALKGLDNIVSEYIRLMDKALVNNNIPLAEKYIYKGKRVNSSHSELPAAESRLAQAKDALQKPVPEPEPVIEPVIEPEIQEPESLVPESERRRLENLKERIKSNPQDTQARREVKNLAEQFEKNIRKAVDTGNYDLARDYIDELKSVLGDNIRAQKRLDELLKKIDEKERQAVNR